MVLGRAWGLSSPLSDDCHGWRDGESAPSPRFEKYEDVVDVWDRGGGVCGGVGRSPCCFEDLLDALGVWSSRKVTLAVDFLLS